ncbi:MAG: phage virion morphogenesis protein [Bauldia sp.]
MAGAGITIDVGGYERTLASLGALVGRVEHPRPMWDAIGGSLVVSTQRRFEAGRAPDGSVWPPSIRALAENGKTLIDTARLMQSITHNATDDGVEVGTNVLYAAIHQFGGVVRAKNAPKLRFRLLGVWHSADQVTIPARPFLGLDQDDEGEIVAIAEDFVAGPEQRQ